MDKEIKSGKSSSLGMPKAPQVDSRMPKKPKLGDAPGRHPLFRLQSIGNVTLGYIFIHDMLCVLLGASCIVGVFYFCCVTIFLAAHLERETCTHRDFVELHLYPLDKAIQLTCVSLISFEIVDFALCASLLSFGARQCVAW